MFVGRSQSLFFFVPQENITVKLAGVLVGTNLFRNVEESLFIAILHHSDFVDGAVQSMSGPAVQRESLRKNKHM